MMMIHVEVHYSPAAGVAELVETFDGQPEKVLLEAARLLVLDQLPNAQVDDEFTINATVIEKGE